MANENTTIKISKEVQKKLKELKHGNESYSLVIERLIDEQRELESYKEKQRDVFNKKINEYYKKGSDETISFLVMWKIASDLVPSEDERIDALCENEFIQGLIADGKKDIVFDSSDLVKEQILLGDSAFYNQIKIVDAFLDTIKE